MPSVLTEKAKALMLQSFRETADPDYYNTGKKTYDSMPEEGRKRVTEELKPICEKFMETEEYNSGDKGYKGYITCCDIYGFCGGMSGWWIFFIIVIVLLVLAGAGAAFWFFYLKRKMGGRDEEEKNMDSEESSTKKSNYDSSIDTY